MLPLGELLLDWRNPRLKASEQIPDEESPESAEAQFRLALILDRYYHPLRIAESIAEHEFFLSEPLIAVPHGQQYRVIEGNRRLAALRGLTDSSLRLEFAKENSGWRKLPPYEATPTYPVLVVNDEAQVAPLLGFRHVSGIEPWAAYAQARFVESLVDNGTDLSEVAELVGKPATEVRSMYRNLDILAQGEEEFGLDVSKARENFGVFRNALGRTGIREFIKAPAPREVDPSVWPLPDDAGENLRRLLTFIFGDEEGKGKVISDSRQLGMLATVLSDSSGEALETLDRTGDLEAAAASTEDESDALVGSLRQAARSIQRVSAKAPASKSDSELLLALMELQSVLRGIEDRMISGAPDAD